MKRILSFAMAIVMLIGSTLWFTSCSDPELEAFTGELYSEILPIKDGAKSIITIVHDDGDYDTVSYMKTHFDTLELTASVAMIANKVVDEKGNETKDAEKWKTIIKETGFDIVCHTQNHSFYGMTDAAHSGRYLHRDSNGVWTNYNFPAGNVTNMTAGAAERLREVFKDSGQKVCTYAIPGIAVQEVEVNGEKVNFQGGRNDEIKQILEESFIACRYSGGSATFGEGEDAVTIPNLNDLSNLNWQSLNSYATITSGTAEEWMQYVDDAAEYGGWGIFLMHRIISEETDYIYNVSKTKATKLFRHISKKVKSGDVWCASFTEASLYLQEIETACTLVEVTGKGISVCVYDELDDNELYDQPLTVKVQVMDSWSGSAKVEYNGEKFTVPINTEADGTKYVLVNVAPDKGEAIINKNK